LSQHSALAYFLIQRYFDFRSLFSQRTVNSEPADLTRPETNVERKHFELTIALIDKMRNMAESKKAKFLIVSTDHWWNYPSKETYHDFLTALKDEGFLVLDVEAMPGFDPSKMLIPDDGHWNQAGNKFVAQQLKVLIEADQLLCKP
jgi:hypothetical protein